jgi:hypothetical protein
MEADLNPQAFGQILSRIRQLLRANLKLFVAIAGAPVLVTLVVEGALAGMILATAAWLQSAGKPVEMTAAGVSVIAVESMVGTAGVVVMLAAFAFFEPAVSFAALELDAGRTITFRQAYAVAWRKPGRYLWLIILRQLIMIAPLVILGVPLLLLWLTFTVGTGKPDPSLAMFLVPLGMLLYLVTLVWIVLAAIRTALVYPVCVAEDRTAWDALRRANSLSKGGRLRIFLVGLVMYAASVAAILACELAFFLLAAIGLIPQIWSHISPVATYLGYIWMGLVGLCFVALLLLCMALIPATYSIAFAVLYRDHIQMERRAAAAGIAG